MDKVILFVPGPSLLENILHDDNVDARFIRSMTVKNGSIKHFVNDSVELQFLARLAVIVLRIDTPRVCPKLWK